MDNFLDLDDTKNTEHTILDNNTYRISIKENSCGWIVYLAFRKFDMSLSRKCKVFQFSKCTKIEAIKNTEKWINRNF